MRLLGFPSLLVLATICFHGSIQSAAAQQRRTSPSFQGVWTWSYYLKDKDMQGSKSADTYKRLAAQQGAQNIKDVPFISLTVGLRQGGNNLSGYCLSKMRFGSEEDSDSFTAIIKGGVAKFDLESSFGGRITFRLSKRENKLYWKVVSVKGANREHAFPETAILQREFFPAVRGVTLGSTLKEVIKSLGAPKLRTITSYDVCGKNLELQYSGLLIELCDDDGLSVRSITVTGKQWRMSRGLRIGMTDLEVEKVLGIPSRRYIDQEQGYEVLSYNFPSFDSFFHIYLSKYKVVRIEMLDDET